RGATRSSMKRAFSSRTLKTASLSTSAYFGSLVTDSRSTTRSRTKRMSRRGALYSAMWSRVRGTRSRWSGGGGGLHHITVGVAREAIGSAVHGLLRGPRPAPEARAPVVGERLLDLGLRVHHERAVLRHRL